MYRDGILFFDCGIWKRFQKIKKGTVVLNNEKRIALRRIIMEGRQAYQTLTIEVIQLDGQDIITSSFDKGEFDIFDGATGEWE